MLVNLVRHATCKARGLRFRTGHFKLGISYSPVSRKGTAGSESPWVFKGVYAAFLLKAFLSILAKVTGCTEYRAGTKRVLLMVVTRS